MEIVSRKLLPEEALSRAVYSVVPSRILDSVTSLDIGVFPSKARRRDEWLNGKEHGLAGVMGRWDIEKRKIEVWLHYCWKYSLDEFGASSWPFGAWNMFLSVLYHEFGHADATSVGVDNGDETDWGPRFDWTVPDDRRLGKHQDHAERVSTELHVKADSMGITLPPERLGMLDEFIHRHRRMWYRRFRAGYHTRLSVFFDKVRMTQHGLHHREAYVGAIQERVGSRLRPKGQTVIDRAGRRHTYYKHEELRRLFGSDALVLHKRWSPVSMASVAFRTGEALIP